MKRVLVIDDEEMIRLNLRAYLEDEGYEVLSAETGEEGLHLLSLNSIDFMIVDMRLPHMDGNAVLLQALKLKPQLNCVIHTGSTEYRVPEELQAFGVRPEHILLKPLQDMSLLTRFMTDMLRNKLIN